MRGLGIPALAVRRLRAVEACSSTAAQTWSSTYNSRVRVHLPGGPNGSKEQGGVGVSEVIAAISAAVTSSVVVYANISVKRLCRKASLEGRAVQARFGLLPSLTIERRHTTEPNNPQDANRSSWTLVTEPTEPRNTTSRGSRTAVRRLASQVSKIRQTSKQGARITTQGSDDQ